MDSSKLLKDLTWADLIIFEDELKLVQEFLQLKHKDLRIICGQLKIKGVKNASKEAMIQSSL